MEWKKTSINEPQASKDDKSKYKQTMCLVFGGDYAGDCINMLAYNHQEKVWDGQDFDDYECDYNKVDYFIELYHIPVPV